MSFNHFSSQEFLNGGNTNRSSEINHDKSNVSSTGSGLPLPRVSYSMVNSVNQSPATARAYQRTPKNNLDQVFTGCISMAQTATSNNTGLKNQKHNIGTAAAGIKRGINRNLLMSSVQNTSKESVFDP